MCRFFSFLYILFNITNCEATLINLIPSATISTPYHLKIKNIKTGDTAHESWHFSPYALNTDDLSEGLYRILYANTGNSYQKQDLRILSTLPGGYKLYTVATPALDIASDITPKLIHLVIASTGVIPIENIWIYSDFLYDFRNTNKNLYLFQTAASSQPRELSIILTHSDLDIDFFQAKTVGGDIVFSWAPSDVSLNVKISDDTGSNVITPQSLSGGQHTVTLPYEVYFIEVKETGNTATFAYNHRDIAGANNPERTLDRCFDPIFPVALINTPNNQFTWNNKSPWINYNFELVNADTEARVHMEYSTIGSTISAPPLAQGNYKWRAVPDHCIGVTKQIEWQMFTFNLGI